MKKRKRIVLIAPKSDVMSEVSDFNIAVTKDSRGGLGGHWKQQIKMWYGTLANWTDHIKGTEAGKLVDNGDCIKITVGEQSLKLDYSEFTQLHAIMLYHQNESHLENPSLSYTFLKPSKGTK